MENGVFPTWIGRIYELLQNNCYYCGIQGSNPNANRYRLSKEEILSACENGYQLDIEALFFKAVRILIIQMELWSLSWQRSEKRYPDCAITLSLGERSKESYQKLYDAGADRYLLRHEAADPELYQKLHPESLSLENRIQCLWNLKRNRLCCRNWIYGWSPLSDG